MIISTGPGVSGNADVFETFGQPDQARLDAAFAKLMKDGPFSVTTEIFYSTDGGATKLASASDTIQIVSATPEPSALLPLGLLLFFGRRRRRS
jgi:MYXO-CTERM domain-containing protein